jgi:hypothetical protein
VRFHAVVVLRELASLLKVSELHPINKNSEMEFQVRNLFAKLHNELLPQAQRTTLLAVDEEVALLP